jgi:hypothetical protein
MTEVLAAKLAVAPGASTLILGVSVFLMGWIGLAPKLVACQLGRTWQLHCAILTYPLIVEVLDLISIWVGSLERQNAVGPDIFLLVSMAGMDQVSSKDEAETNWNVEHESLVLIDRRGTSWIYNELRVRLKRDEERSEGFPFGKSRHCRCRDVVVWYLILAAGLAP